MLAVVPIEAAAPMSRRAAPTFKRECLWCGAGFRASARHGEFCRLECRRAFNNQRAMRGAELYDLAMALRHDRKTATAYGVLKLMWRLCSLFRDEDKRLRAGRKSWRSPAEIIERRPYLNNELMQKRYLRPKSDWGKPCLSGFHP